MLLTRWQAVHLLDAVWFYRMLTVHGMNMLIFFIIFFEMAVLYFASAILLNARVPAAKTGWVAFGLMVVGTLLVEWTMFTGRADVLFTSYVPLRAEPPYYLGVILFAVGALTVVGHFFAILVVAKREKTYTGSLPLVTFGALTAAVIAAATLLHGAMNAGENTLKTVVPELRGDAPTTFIYAGALLVLAALAARRLYREGRPPAV